MDRELPGDRKLSCSNSVQGQPFHEPCCKSVQQCNFLQASLLLAEASGDLFPKLILLKIRRMDEAFVQLLCKVWTSEESMCFKDFACSP